MQAYREMVGAMTGRELTPDEERRAEDVIGSGGPNRRQRRKAAREARKSARKAHANARAR